MSTTAEYHVRPVAILGLPEPADLGDLWLGHALFCVLDAFEVPVEERRALIEARGSPYGLMARPLQGDAEARLERLDSCRLAVLFGGLALEARLDRLLRRSDATDWPTVAHLPPAERFRMSRRLLGGADSARWDDPAVLELAVELFELRDELVDAVGQPGAALLEMSPEFSPTRAGAMVGASARLCTFLAALVGEADSGTAHLVEQTIPALTRWASDRSQPRAGGTYEPGWEWTNAVDSPPDLAGS